MASIDIQRDLAAALEAGLLQKFGDPVGKLMATAIGYAPQEWLEKDRMKKLVEYDSGAIVNAVLAGSVTGATMHHIQFAMVGSALLHDNEAVLRWAKEGLTRCARCEGDWPRTAGEWEWVLQNVDRYVHLIREVKYFLNQV